MGGREEGSEKEGVGKGRRVGRGEEGWGRGKGRGEGRYGCSHHTSYGSSSSGNDFLHEKGIDVCRQVQLLISQATSHENLCQCYIGW